MVIYLDLLKNKLSGSIRIVKHLDGVELGRKTMKVMLARTKKVPKMKDVSSKAKMMMSRAKFS